jgi:hypothetical protein
MRRRTRRVVELKLCRDETIWSPAVAHTHRLVRPEFGKAAAAKCFHVNKNVGRGVTTRQKSEPAQSVEPLHLRSLPVALRLDHNMGALGNSEGRIAVESSMLQMRMAFRPLELLTTSQTIRAPSEAV